MSDYFSDRENGPRARTEQEITPTVWAAVAATVQGLMNGGALAQRFPERCPDGQAICGCDEGALAASVMAEMPGLVWPLQIAAEVDEGFMSRREPFAPSTLLVLDFIEFVHRAVAKPVPGKYHEYFSHHHLTFDQEAGQEDFRATINRLFSRNGLAFEMLTSGRIVRVLPPVLAEELRRTTFNSGDRTLDVLLEECRLKFSDRNPLVRREALERLWDAWERLKSLPESTGEPGNKEAADLGIAVTTDTGAGAFLQGKSILVFNIHKLGNGLSVFGTADTGVKIPLGFVLVDDAHACLSSTESQFTLTVTDGSAAYKGLMQLFRDELLEQDDTKLLEIADGASDQEMLVPFWVWHQQACRSPRC